MGKVVSLVKHLFNRKEQDTDYLDGTEFDSQEELLSETDQEDQENYFWQEENKDLKATGDTEEEDEEYEIVEREILPQKIICPDCGGITLEGLDFCDKCGGEL
ncbi:MAG: hypothetical protein K0S47_2436 [Herbinix sp.]|jgi:hypothetical protein|nr:hypothetical protein [Herbinix sp.]